MAAGQPAAAGSFSAASLSLADGVLATMMLKKLTVIAGVLLTLGIGSGTGAFFVRGSRAQDPRPDATPKKPASAAKAPDQPDVDPLLKELIEAATRRLDAQRAYYEEGRITLDRFIAAVENLERVKLLATKDPAERRAIRLRRVELAREIENREQAELQVGRGTESDLAEARQARVQAEYDMKAGEKEDADEAALLRRIAELERKVERLQKERGGSGRPSAK